MAGESGGRGEVTIATRITGAAIDGLDPFAGSAATSDGAVLVFQGRVRDSNEGREVTGLEYQAYVEMAERELRAICEEAAERFELGSISVAHRVGRLELGEASVTIGVTAPHRAPCYEASRFIIEALKERLPVWKHECYADGESEWVGTARAGGVPPRPEGAA